MLVSQRLENDLPSGPKSGRRRHDDETAPAPSAETSCPESQTHPPAQPAPTKHRDEQGKQLMLAFQAGNEGAFEALVHGYQEAVKHFLYRYLRDRHRTEDLTQEVFIRVFRSRERYVPTAGFRTWLFTIATRLALNEIRGIRRRRRVFADLDDDPDGSMEPAWQSAPDRREPDPSARAEQRELDQVLGDLIEELPSKQRAAVLLSRIEEMPYKDIAAALDVTVLAVKSLLMRARETLRGRVERYLTGKPTPRSTNDLT
jgi:RNA polymerase sigma-70 factor (ECF subfamily)